MLIAKQVIEKRAENPIQFTSKKSFLAENGAKKTTDKYDKRQMKSFLL